MFAFQKRNIRNIKGDFKRSAVPQRLLLQGLQPLLHHQGHQPLHLQGLQLLFQERQPILPRQGHPS
jgi:hypothetical protein